MFKLESLSCYTSGSLSFRAVIEIHGTGKKKHNSNFFLSMTISQHHLHPSLVCVENRRTTLPESSGSAFTENALNHLRSVSALLPDVAKEQDALICIFF